MGDSKEFPGLGFNPAPGIVAAVESLLSQIRDATGKVSSAGQDLDRVLTESSAWRGPAAAGCRNYVQAVAPHVSTLRAGLLSVQMALSSWASALSEYQRIRNSLEVDAVEARARMNQAKSNPDIKYNPIPLTPDQEDDEAKSKAALRAYYTAKDELDQIIKRARDLEEQHDGSAKSAAKEIREAVDRLDDLRKNPGKSWIIPPDFQKPPPPREDLPEVRPYDIRDPTAKDKKTELEVDLMVAGQAGLGNPRAAELLDHWLKNTGEDFQFNSQEMLNDVPNLQEQVRNLMLQNAGKGDFDSGWQSATIASDLDKPNATPKLQDWYYSMNGYSYKISGNARIIDGVLCGEIRLDIYKRYNWGNPISGGTPRDDIDMKFDDVPQNDIAGLHAAGRAKDFDVVGSSTMWVRDPQ